MATQRAAVIESFDAPPRAGRFAEPQPADGQEVVEVLAVGLSRATRLIAAGKHYTSPKTLPALAGIDGVVRRPNGDLGFVMTPGVGTLAERIAVDPATLIPVPRHADPATVAATVNGAQSSWVALKGRVGFEAGQSVLVLGATGNAGSLAVRIAKHLGAARVIAAGRDRARLAALRGAGADELVALTGDEDRDAAGLAVAAEVDVVLDYVWGPPTQVALRGVLGARTQHRRPLDWVQVGGTGGPEITLGGPSLLANALRVSGSGFGSVELGAADLPGLTAAIADGVIAVRPLAVPLGEVEQAWGRADVPGERSVIMVQDG